MEDQFNKELGYIKDEKIRNSLILILEELPDYWFSVPASSTENPTIGDKYTSHEKDLMLLALLVHDGLKSGNPQEKYTRFDHPILMANFILDNKDKFELNEEDAKFIADVIKTHMGPWIEDYNGNVVLEKPKTKYQNFVHMCDFLASKKFLLVPFNDNNEIEE